MSSRARRFSSFAAYGLGSCLCGMSMAWSALAAAPLRPMGAGEPAVQSSPAPVGQWDASDIRASWQVWTPGVAGSSTACPTHAVPGWRTVAIDAGAASVHIAGGGTATRHLALREELLPEVHYLPDGRYALMATRTGWVLRLDLELAQLVAEVRVGLLTNGTALSAPRAGHPGLLAIANGEPHTLAVLDEQLQLIKLLPVIDKAGGTSSGVAAIQTAAARGSFVATLALVPELWEISYQPTAPEIGLGLVHDFQYREGQFVPGYLNPQRSVLPTPAREFFLAGSGHEVITAHGGADSQHSGAGARMRITHLDTRGKVAELTLPGWPALDRSLSWNSKGQERLAVPNTSLGLVSIVDPKRWALLGHLRTDGPVRFVSTTPESPWLWIDSGALPGAPLSTLKVDKTSLDVVEEVADGAGSAAIGKLAGKADACAL